MQVNPDIISLAHRMADAAGAIIRSYFQKAAVVERKQDASPVTKADREAEAAMRALIEAECPEHGIIGEEWGNIRPDATWQWVLDPIDGTRAFIAGFPTFVTLIALAKDGIPVLGVIDQPVLRERWVGAEGQNSLLNNASIHSSKAALLENARISTTSIHYFTAEESHIYEKLRFQCAASQEGGDGYAYAMLASGKLDLVVDAGLKPYDFCALKPVVEGAGGIITDWQGNPLTIASRGQVVAAASKALHKQALTILQTEA